MYPNNKRVFIVMNKLQQLEWMLAHKAGGKKAKLARLLGITDASIGMWFHREYFDIEKVAQAFDDLSAEWILRGEGEPFKTAHATVSDDNRSEELSAEIEELKHQNKILLNKLMEIQKIILL